LQKGEGTRVGQETPTPRPPHALSL